MSARFPLFEFRGHVYVEDKTVDPMHPWHVLYVEGGRDGDGNVHAASVTMLGIYELTAKHPVYRAALRKGFEQLADLVAAPR